MISIYKPCLFTGKVSQVTTTHPGIFRVRAPWADGVSGRIITVESGDQSKPNRIGGNLVANYNEYYGQCFLAH